MDFKLSKEMKINVFEEQKCQLSSKERIKKELQINKNVIAFDIFKDGKEIGFAMLREFEKGKFFLWNFAIDKDFQNQGIGTTTLKELIKLLITEYDCTEITTTYILGNKVAQRLYEKVGFTQTDVVEEDDIHEVDMELKIL